MGVFLNKAILHNTYSTVQEDLAIHCEDELKKRKHSPLEVKSHTLVWEECYLHHSIY